MIFLKKIYNNYFSKINFFTLFLTSYFCIYLPLTFILTIVSNYFPVRFLSLSLLFVVYLLLFFSIPYLIKTLNGYDLVFFGFIFTAILMLLVRNSIDSNIAGGIKTIMTSCIFFYVGFRFSKKENQIEVIVFGFSLTVIALLLLSIYRKYNHFGEDMTNSYLSAFSAGMVFAYILLVNKKRFIFLLGLILVIFGMVSSFLFGSRAPIVLLLFLIVILTLHKYVFKNTKNIFKILIFGIFLISILFLIMSFALDYLVINGVVSYYDPTYKFISSLLSMSGRIQFFKTLFESFKFSPIFGNGLFGDRIYSKTFIYIATDPINFGFIPVSANTIYSHNILIEFLLSFGFLTTTLILFFVFNYVKEKISNVDFNDYRKVLFFPALVIGVISLMISNSFIVSIYFWGFIGISISCLSHIKKYKFVKTTNIPYISINV